MKYSYKPEEIPVSPSSKRVQVIWRPVIPVILIKNDKLVGYEALIDSGADHNIFHAELARILGIKLTKGKSRKVYGLSGKAIKGYMHNIEIKPVGMRKYKSTVIFTNKLPDHALGVLGNVGFFDRFTVRFNFNKKTIIVKP